MTRTVLKKSYNQIYSEITSGRVLDGELLYTEIREIYLHLATDCG